MLHLQYDLLHQSKSACTYQVLKADKKIAKVLIEGDGTRTITKQAGRPMPDAERRLIEAFLPLI
jgi:hypothetical protein